MKNTVTITSALPPEIISALNDYSKKLNIPKSKLISIAIGNYINELKRNEYVDSFKRARNDSEIQSLTEFGISDYLDIIKQ